MNTSNQTAIKESKMKLTSSNLIRWAGLGAIAAGVFFAAIQPIHPADTLASVTTSAWGIITPLKVIMCLLFLFGITAIYARQMKKAGWLGLVGFLMFSLAWAFELAFIFAEAFIIPLLATAAPTFVEGFFGIVNGHPVDTNLGALPGLYALLSVLYIFGGLLFGIATLRAAILPRWAASLLIVASILTPLAGLLPHELQRYAAVPVGLALASLGYALWSERGEKASEPIPGKGSPQLLQTATE